MTNTFFKISGEEIYQLVDDNPALRNWARVRYEWITDWVEEERQREEVESRTRDESFVQ